MKDTSSVQMLICMLKQKKCGENTKHTVKTQICAHILIELIKKKEQKITWCVLAPYIVS